MEKANSYFEKKVNVYFIHSLTDIKHLLMNTLLCWAKHSIEGETRRLHKVLRVEMDSPHTITEESMSKLQN